MRNFRENFYFQREYPSLVNIINIKSKKMKKTKMVFASMILMIGLMATPYQSYGFEGEDEDIERNGCPQCDGPSVWDEIVNWWEDLLE